MSGAALRRHLLMLSTGLAAGRALTFAQGVFLARILGPAELGKYAVLISVCWLISRIGEFGLTHAFSHYARTIDNSLRALLRVTAINTLVGCVVTALAFILLTFLPLPVFQEVQSSLWWITVLYLYSVVGTVGALLPVFLMAAGDYRNYVLFFHAGVALQVILQLTAYSLFGPELFWLIVANLVSQTGTAVILLFHLKRVETAQQNAALVSTRACYWFGLQVYWGTMMKLASTRLEVPLISGIMPSGIVGRYSIASNLRDAAMVPQQLYSGIFQNEMIDRGKSQDSRAGALLIKGLIVQFLISVSISVTALVSLPILIPWLYGREFAGAVVPAILLVASTIFSGMAGLCWIGFNASRKPHLIGVVSTISGVLSPLCIYLVASKYGLIGVALASVAASFITFAISVLFTVRLNRFEWANIGAAVRELKSLAARYAHV